MTLSKKSLLFKIFQLTYPGKEPKSLCSYIWGIIVAATIFILLGWFYILLFLLNKILNLFMTRKENWFEDGFFDPFNMLGALCINMAAYMLVSLIMLIANRFNINHMPFFWVPGLMFIAVALLLVLIYLITTHLKFKARSVGPKEPNIFIEYFKAQYKKYCPPITWKD